jgi:DNA (cytosine-5)-methyltransferase 1
MKKSIRHEDDAANYQHQSYSIRDVLKASKARKFGVVSLFAGGGGSSTGYRLAGGKIHFASEFIQTAADTYSANYPNTPVMMGDIRKFTKSAAKVKSLFAEHGIAPGELDMLDASPPCASFSTAGKGQSKTRAKNVVYSETRQDNVGTLIHDAVFMTNVMQPRVAIIENVAAIKSSPVYQEACDRLRREGFLVFAKVLSSSNFGVPQRRKRLFTLAVRSDIAATAGISSEKGLTDIFPEGSTYEPTVRNAIGNLDIEPRERNMLLGAIRKSAQYEFANLLTTDPTNCIKIGHIAQGWTSDFNLVRAAWDHPCPTLTQLGQQLSRSGVIHPSENRKFAISELKRLTGLPDDYILTGNFNQRAERITRMVPPQLTKALSESIYEKVLK